MITRTSSFIDRLNFSFGCVALLCVATVLGGVLFPVREASAQTTVAGFTPGSFQVSPGGAATYTIPIQVPPGTAGMEPKLALTYNSQGGNGLLGMGWSLSGLSAITRCPQTVAQDGPQGGFVGGVNYNERDRYCLDGQRLVLVVGASYGADGAEYRTERESFTKIISYGAPGSGPTYVGPNFFRVWTKSGQIMEYGNSADSRIEASGKSVARVWAVNKISDTKGNYLTVTYAEDTPNGDFYPTRIDYNYTGTPSTSNASVQFVPDPLGRTDVVPAYEGGSVIKTMKRLINIRTYAGTQLVKDYRLSYINSGSTARSKLASVQECDGLGTSCLSAITSQWQVSIDGVFTMGPVDANQNSIGLGALLNGDYTNIYLGDFNGDGKTDILRQEKGSWAGDSFMMNQVFIAPVLLPDVLNVITNSLGAVTTIAYKPLTDSTVYMKESGSAYPVIDLQAPIYAVSSTNQSNAVGGNFVNNYFYTGAKAHQLGGGLLGFRQMQTTDASTGIKGTITFRQDYPFQGLPSSVVKTQSTGAVLNQVTNTWADNPVVNSLTYNFSTGKYHRSDLTQTVETSNDLNGAVLPTVTTTTGYDAYGNATSITVGTGDGYSKSIVNTYTNDTANWFVGRLTRSQVTSTTP